MTDGPLWSAEIERRHAAGDWAFASLEEAEAARAELLTCLVAGHLRDAAAQLPGAVVTPGDPRQHTSGIFALLDTVSDDRRQAMLADLAESLQDAAEDGNLVSTRALVDAWERGIDASLEEIDEIIEASYVGIVEPQECSALEGLDGGGDTSAPLRPALRIVSND